MRRLLWLMLFVSTQALAQSAITVSCGDCSMFQAIQVFIDGADRATDQAVTIGNVAPGKHEVRVVKWASPFTTEAMYTGVVDFPDRTELRAKVTKGKLDVYGRGAYAPPPPPVVGPSAEQVDSARSWLDEAKETLDDVKERVEGSDDECVGRLSGRLGALEDAIADARGQTTREWVDVAVAKAVETQKVLATRCARRNVSKWGKPIDRVVARLQSASRAL